MIANVPTAHPQKSGENPDSYPGINPTNEMNIIATKAKPINSRTFIISTKPGAKSFKKIYYFMF